MAPRETFTASEAAEIAGLPYPTLTRMRALDLFPPTAEWPKERGAQSLYGFEDVAGLCAIADLRRQTSELARLKGLADFMCTPAVRHELQSGESTKCVILRCDGRLLLVERSIPLSEITADDSASVVHIICIQRIIDKVGMCVAENGIMSRERPRRGRPPRQPGESREAAATTAPRKPTNPVPSGGEREQRRGRK